jgi:hypothetical protein
LTCIWHTNKFSLLALVQTLRRTKFEFLDCGRLRVVARVRQRRGARKKEEVPIGIGGVTYGSVGVVTISRTKGQVRLEVYVGMEKGSEEFGDAP